MKNKKIKILFLVAIVLIGLYFFLTQVPINKRIYCNYPYELIEDKCVNVDIEPAKYKIKYSCNNVYNEKLKGNTCYYDVYTIPYTQTSCPTYYRSYGSRCKFNFGTYSSSCPTGTLYWAGKCYNEYATPKTTSTCFSGKLVSGRCVTTYSYSAMQNYEYYCEDLDYELVGTNCAKRTWMWPEEEYTPLLDF